MKYDIIVVGAGSAGLNIASFMNRIGLKVLLCEKEKVGGDCLNYGCVPSKALISLAHTANEAKKAEDLGLRITGSVDLKKIEKTIKKRQDVIRKHESVDYFRKQGIDVELGKTIFSGKNTVTVNGKTYRAKKIIIATGSRPLIPKIPGLENIMYFTNETIFENKKLPKKLVVIGNGPIGIEIAQSYKMLGSEVTVVGRDKILPKDDKEISDILYKILKKEGINFLITYNPIRFEGKDTLVVQEYDRKQRKNIGREITIKFDAVLLAVGRKLNIDNLNLEKARVELDEKKKIKLDKYLRTTNKKVYVCGDAAGSFMFTHWAETQAANVIRNLLNPFKKQLDNNKIAWVTYTDPEVASFGKREQDLEKDNISFKTIKIELGDVDRAICEGIEDGILKLFIRKDRILGGTIIAKNGGELVGELISAMTLKIPFSKLFERIYPYPTMARINRKAVSKYLGEKLNDSSSKFLRFLFRVLN